MWCSTSGVEFYLLLFYISILANKKATPCTPAGVGGHKHLPSIEQRSFTDRRRSFSITVFLVGKQATTKTNDLTIREGDRRRTPSEDAQPNFATAVAALA